MWGSLIDYWHYTNDTSYNNVVQEALIYQASPTNDFMMPNQGFDLGNDDQAFWAMTAMSAAEYSFPVPHTYIAPDVWLLLAINSFNDFVPRWDAAQCGGGLKWQFNPQNSGFNYKSSIANGGFFNLAARLARYTGNTTYSDWAEKTWDWMVEAKFIDGTTYAIYDGAGDLNNCQNPNPLQWTYNNAVFLYGAAVMASISPPSSAWLARTQSLLNYAVTQFFTPSSVMYESACETVGTCNNDQHSFKAYLSRFMAATSVVVPSLESQIMDLIQPSAKAAAAACTGGVNGTLCGSKWYTGAYDGITGVGQEMAALEVVHALLAPGSSPPKIVGNPREGTVRRDLPARRRRI
jgi:hypothetical protein